MKKNTSICVIKIKSKTRKRNEKWENGKIDIIVKNLISDFV